MIRHTQKGISWYSWAHLDRQDVIAGTTCRNTDSHKAFNLAFHTPGDKQAVKENRERLSRVLGTDPAAFTTGEQTHSCNSRILPSQRNDLAETDALILTDSSLLGVILTADCLPVILFDRENRIGAVIHAGWKGIAGGIVPITLKRMRNEGGCRMENILAAEGPAIGSCCYQVDRPVFHAMTLSWPETSSAFRPDGKDHWRFSLEEAVQYQLLQAGLPQENIETAGLCTCCHSDFFSWRGDGKETGRVGTFLRTERVL